MHAGTGCGGSAQRACEREQPTGGGGPQAPPNPDPTESLAV